MKKVVRIAANIETNRAHGRSLLLGLAEVCAAHDDWQLEPVSDEMLKNPAKIQHFDGLIVRVMDDETADALIASGKPVIDTYGRIEGNPLPFIRLDDKSIAESAFACFAGHRYTRLAYCGFPGIRFSDARGAHFARLAEAHGGACATYRGSAAGRLRDTYFKNEKMDFVGDARPLRGWVKSLPKPIAVFCCNDIRAYHLLKVCGDEGIDVPREVAVIGVDNDPLVCAFAQPTLSSIDTGAAEIGRISVRMLEMLMGNPRNPPANVLHKVGGVVERRSTEAYDVRVEWLSDALVFIRRKLGEGVSAGDVIRRVGLSHTAVNAAFRKELGRSVQQEIIHQRRERACRMLAETGLSAAAISAECGYPSPQYFAHRFLAWFGTTPDAWRRSARR